jgi:hypothetical protein
MLRLLADQNHSSSTTVSRHSLLKPAIAITACIMMARHPSLLASIPLFQAPSFHELRPLLRSTLTAGGRL